MKLNEIKYRAKDAIFNLRRSLKTDHEKRQLNEIINLYNAFDQLQTLRIDEKVLKTALLRMFLQKYIEHKNPEVAIIEVMKDITEGMGLDYNYEFSKIDIVRQIQFNQDIMKIGSDEELMPLVDEVEELMTKYLPYK